jgi:hypothetical protein
MAETGGTTTQSGIYYQNSVAALFLGRLVDSRSRPPEDRVIEVRVEAPVHVDDIVARYADGGRSYIQVKENLDFSSAAWRKLWTDFVQQARVASGTGERFSLILVVSCYTDDIGQLRELCERVQGKLNATEWWDSLNQRQCAIADKVVSALPKSTREAAFNVLDKVQVWVWPLERIEPDYVPLWIPQTSIGAVGLFRCLRDMVGGHARVRAVFRSSALLDRLRSEHAVRIVDAPHWGSDAYRQTIIASMGRLSVPGTSLAGYIQDLFMWPQLYEWSLEHRYRDFEEEDLRWRWNHLAETIDLRDYPRGNVRRAVVNAGAGWV